MSGKQGGREGMGGLFGRAGAKRAVRPTATPLSRLNASESAFTWRARTDCRIIVDTKMTVSRNERGTQW